MVTHSCCRWWCDLVTVGGCSAGAAFGGRQAVVVRAGGDAEGVAGTELRISALLQPLTVEERPCTARTAVQTSSVRSDPRRGIQSGCIPV